MSPTSYSASGGLHPANLLPLIKQNASLREALRFSCSGDRIRPEDGGFQRIAFGSALQLELRLHFVSANLRL